MKFPFSIKIFIHIHSIPHVILEVAFRESRLGMLQFLSLVQPVDVSETHGESFSKNVKFWYNWMSCAVTLLYVLL